MLQTGLHHEIEAVEFRVVYYMCMYLELAKGHGTKVQYTELQCMM